MAEHYLGEIRMFAGRYAPAGWALCDGQRLPITEHQALYDLLGTTYGGDGEETFCLPDLRGRVPVHPGPAAGETFVIGDRGWAAPPDGPPEGSSSVLRYEDLTYVIALDGVSPDEDSEDLSEYPLVGEVRIFPFGFAPQGWMSCSGSDLGLESNIALFSVIGTRYGGDGRYTFALPDLQGRAARHPGTVGADADLEAPPDGALPRSPGRLELDYYIAVQGYYPRA